ncbi:MAG: FAD-linked oxidase C-terminal domain-containing protein [Planctomycetota bacterium]
MDPERQRIAEDLRGLIAGEVLADDLSLRLYSTDASSYEVRPQAVVRPRVTADVVATVRYAGDSGIAIHARGAGSGLAGGALGRGIVIDFSRFMRRVISVGDSTARVQAGVVHADLNRTLARHGRLFGPDPAMSQVTTMGGVLAVDASGSHFPWYGSARRHVCRMKVVLADGEVVQLDSPLAASRAEAPKLAVGGGERVQRLATAVSELVRRRRDVIEAHRTLAPVDSSGYALKQAARGDEVDLARLMVGSEGTLGLITEAVVTTQPTPPSRGTLLLIFDSLDKAARSLEALLPLMPSACDLMDRRHLSLARETDVRYELIIPAAAEAVLLVEHFAEDDDELRAKIDRTVTVVRDEQGLAAGAYVADEPDDADLLWNLARRFVPTLHRLKGARRAVPGIEDIAVPPAALPVFFRHLQDTLKRQEVTASLFGHAGHGQLHIRPLLNLASSDDVRRLELLTAELYEKVWLLGGTVSGEHGDGLSRTPFLSRQHGPLLNVFRELKRVFDPAGVLNPGKIVPDAGARMNRDMRRVVAPDPAPGTGGVGPTPPVDLVELQLDWRPDEMAHAARACNGCAACRTRSEEVRMCPIFHFAPREESSPRAKANLARAVLTGLLPADTLTRDAARDVADLCVHCHMCRVDCPANVDIPKLMLEAKAAHVDANGLAPHDWWLSRIDAVSRWASRAPGVANWLLANRQSRWFMEKVFGLAQGRRMPRLAGRPFLQRATARRWRKPDRQSGEKVIYFVDTFANYYDADLAEALVGVLTHNGVGVYIPPAQEHSAMPMITQGALEPARRIASRNVELLAEGVRQGYTIVASEPSAVLALTHEYPLILGEDEDVRLVADNTREAAHYLWGLHQRGGLRLDFQSLPARVAHHTPCHVRALGFGAPATNLLRLIPELRVVPVDKGCSGMAGVYGLKHANYRSSLRAGLPLLAELRTGGYSLGSTECSTCKIQMEQSAPQATLHPVKLLAMSYGLPTGTTKGLAAAGAAETISGGSA